MNTERFSDLRSAGRALASGLVDYEGHSETVILGVALAGAPVAHEVALRLGAPMDLILIRRLLVGNGVGSHLCAVNVAGQTILDEGISLPTQPSAPLEHFLHEAIDKFSQREKLCRRGREPLQLTGRTVIVVDCGIRTGSTMKAAARAVRQVNPERMIGAVPVSSPEGLADVAPLFDDFVCLKRPEIFVNAGYWYADFGRPADDKVADLLI